MVLRPQLKMVTTSLIFLRITNITIVQKHHQNSTFNGTSLSYTGKKSPKPSIYHTLALKDLGRFDSFVLALKDLGRFDSFIFP
jgi:hypothetical protein